MVVELERRNRLFQEESNGNLTKSVAKDSLKIVWVLKSLWQSSPTEVVFLSCLKIFPVKSKKGLAYESRKRHQLSEDM